MPNYSEFKSGPVLRFRMNENGQLIQIPASLGIRNPITFEISAVDDRTICIAPPKTNAQSN